MINNLRYILALIPALVAAPALQSATTQTVVEIKMPEARAAHSATELMDGRILLAGGCSADGCEEGISGTAVIFDAKSRSFTPAGNLITPRVGHRSIRLRDGSVLLIGGWTAKGVTASIERYVPSTNQFVHFADMNTARDGFSATALLDGNILIAGGYAENMQRLDSIEVFDPRTRKVIHQAALETARMSHTATRLSDGKVIIAGGSNNARRVIDTIEQFDPQTKTIKQTGRMLKARHKHAALLAGNNILFMGGAGIPESDNFYSAVESWNIDSQQSQPHRNLNYGRYKFLDSVLLLPSGSVFIGTSGSDIEQLSRNSVAPAALSVNPNRSRLSFSTATLLSDGQVLIAGGYDSNISVTRSAWLVKPN